MPTKFETYKTHKKLPLIVSLLYVIGTMTASIFSPVEYINSVYEYWLVVPIVGGSLLCLSFGYYLGLQTKRISRPTSARLDLSEYRTKKLLKTSSQIALISLFLELLYVLAIGHFSLSFGSLGDLYSTRIEDNANVVILLRFLSAPFRVIAISLGFLKYRKLDRFLRRIVLADGLLYILVFMFGYGNQKGVSDIAIYLAIALYVNRMREGKRMSRRSIKWIVFGGVVVFFLFSFMQYLRYAPRGINAHNYHIFSTGDFRYNTNHILFRIFGDKLGFGMASIINGYMSQGYYGLSLCLKLPFEWTYGLGSSYAIISLLNKFGINGIYERTYLGRMQAGFVRHGLSSWNTIYPWLASDFTWLGAVVFFLVGGYLLAKTWREIILFDNSISYVLFINLVLLIVFIPANNQLFHGYDSFIATWSIFLFWVFKRRRFSCE